MNEFLGALPSLDRLGGLSVLLLVALAVITDKLVWHTRLKKAETDRDKWQEIAVQALTGPAQAGVRAAEVAVGVVSALPDPNARASAEHSNAGGG